MITTERLNIRIASDDEMHALISEQTDEGLRAAYGEMLAGCLEHPDEREWYAIWNICLISGKHIGELCFKGLSENGTAEIGYGILPEFWGQGYATEAVSAVVQWASAQSGVRTIEAETEESNTASKRVLEKSGFVPTGEYGEEGPRFVWNKR